MAGRHNTDIRNKLDVTEYLGNYSIALSLAKTVELWPD